MSAEDMLDDAMDEAERDRLWNRVDEHEHGEHVTSWAGCPSCEGDWGLSEEVYGLLTGGDDRGKVTP